MTEYYNIVPWFNSVEWLQAYESIYTKPNKKAALELIHVWKARCPSLPSGVESTLTLLEVLIQDENTADDVTNDQLLRLAYSSAIMRFVNHMLDTETAKGTTLYQAARNLGVPDWIIDLRHDTAHSNNLPSIELLREASQIGMEWLEINYWAKYKECIKDYTTGNKDSETAEFNKIAAVMHFCTSLSFCAHSKCKIKNLSEIPNSSMRESIVNDARDLFGDHYDFSNLKTVSVVSLVNILNSHSKKLLRSKDAILHVNQALLGEESLFLSLELLNYMGSESFHHKKKLAASYVQCFEVLLTFLHSNNMLLDFILGLIEITNKTENDDKRRLLAALWISEILIALNKSKLFMERMKRSGSTDIESKKKQELTALYHHWFPNERVKSLLLDMQKCVPPQLMDIKFLQPVISTYNPYLKMFIKDLLNLVEPRLPKHVSENICKLAELISSPEKFPMDTSKIYTVEDLKMDLDADETESCVQPESIDDCIMFVDNEDPSENNQNDVSYGIWKLSAANQNWSKCPFGLLPWQ